jgi:acetyl esterase/lipase
LAAAPKFEIAIAIRPVNLTHMLKSVTALAATLLTAYTMSAQTNSFPLWPNGAPGAIGTAASDIPTLTVFLPEQTNPPMAAMIVCPGGGYSHLAGHEGALYARWLNSHGIAAFVLKYRLGDTNGYHYPAMFLDAARALRTVRARAGEWNLDPKHIGIMGSSAGGHLSALLATKFDSGDSNATDVIERVSSRPDVAVLCYPVITMDDRYAHQGSKKNLLGPDPAPGLADEISPEKHVTTNTPPCFIWATADDQTVPVENSLMFAGALRAARVPVELHIYESGKHGLGLGSHTWEPDKFLPWTHECATWLRRHGFGK